MCERSGLEHWRTSLDEHGSDDTRKGDDGGGEGERDGGGSGLSGVGSGGLVGVGSLGDGLGQGSVQELLSAHAGDKLLDLLDESSGRVVGRVGELGRVGESLDLSEHALGAVGAEELSRVGDRGRVDERRERDLLVDQRLIAG